MTVTAGEMKRRSMKKIKTSVKTAAEPQKAKSEAVPWAIPAEAAAAGAEESARGSCGRRRHSVPEIILFPPVP